MSYDKYVKCSPTYQRSFSPITSTQPDTYSYPTPGGEYNIKFVVFGYLHPRKLTWNLKIPPWKGRNIYKPPVLGFHVSFGGCIGFSRGGCPRGVGNWGTLRIPFGKIGDWGTLGKIRGITTSPLKNPIRYGQQQIPIPFIYHFIHEVGSCGAGVGEYAII